VSDAALSALRSRVASLRREERRQELSLQNTVADDSVAKSFDDFCDEDTSRPAEADVRLVSLNLWQPMLGSWPKRIQELAKLLKELAPDVIALQEVRGHGASGKSWAEELMQECNDHGFTKLQYAHYVPGTGGGAAYGGEEPGGWTEEGVALLSVYPFVPGGDDVLGMPPTQSDANPRASLAALVQTPLGRLRVAASHLSYDRNQQCLSVFEQFAPWLDRLWETDAHGTIGQVVLGDLNTYSDFEWPIDALTSDYDTLRAIGGPCVDRIGAQNELPRLKAPRFVDAWTSTNTGGKAGWTFPSPESMLLDPSRPDRVLVRSQKLRPWQTLITGCDKIVNTDFQVSDHRLVVSDLQVYR